jgi:hypothetical protein
MDASFVPIVLLALTAGMIGAAIELRDATKPPSCPECSHCRAAAYERRREAEERERRQAELQSWYARHHGVDGRDEDQRRD